LPTDDRRWLEVHHSCTTFEEGDFDLPAAESEDVAVVESNGLEHGPTVEERPVRAAQILDEELVLAVDEAKVPPRHRRIVNPEPAFEIPTDDRDPERQLDGIASILQDDPPHQIIIAGFRPTLSKVRHYP